MLRGRAIHVGVALALALSLLGGGGRPLPADGPRAAAAAVTSALSILEQHPVAPGASRARAVFATSSGSQAAHLLHFDPTTAGVQFKSLLSNDRVTGVETVRSQATRWSREGHRVVFAVNGGVWYGSSPELNAPHGLHVQNGELVTGDTVAKVAVGIAADGTARFGAPTVTGKVTLATGAEIVIDRVNKSRRTGDTVLFTPRWGASTLAAADGVEVVVRLPGVLGVASTVPATVQEVRIGTGNATVAPGTMVIAADGPDEAALTALVPGETVTISTAVTEGWADLPSVVAGRERVLLRGALDIWPRPASADERHPRSAVGVKADGTIVVLVVDGRQPGYSSGVTLPELAEILAGLGVVEAINLDGGGSSTFVARRTGDSGVSLLNRPSDGSERAVSNSLALVSTIPTGPLAGIVVSPSSANVVQGTTRQFAARGFDAAWNGVPVAASSVAWAATGAGTIDAGGLFRARTVGAATVSARAGGFTAEAAVTVTPDVTAPVVGSVVVRPSLQGRVPDLSVPMTVTWSGTDVGSGIGRYRLRESVNGGAWTDVPLASPTATSVNLLLPAGRTYRYTVQATDRVGNVSTLRAAAASRPRAVSEGSTSVTWFGRWTGLVHSAWLHGRARTSSTAGAASRFTFSGREVALVAGVGPTRGLARIYVDGTFVTSVDLRRATASGRIVVFRHRFTVVGTHRIEVRVAGTAGRPRVDVDGFVVVDPGT